MRRDEEINEVDSSKDFDNMRPKTRSECLKASWAIYRRCVCIVAVCRIEGLEAYFE